MIDGRRATKQGRGRRRGPTPGLAVALAFACFAPAARGDDAAGRALFAACVTCHGVRGEGVPDVHAPNLAGQTASYLERQLRNFRDGIRGAAPSDANGAAMRAAAATLSDPQIRELTAFIASLPIPSTPASVTGDLRSGRNLYQSSCNACHGPQAEGNPSFDAPRLAGTSDAYLVRQLEAFTNGWRGTHAGDRPGRQMALIARTLADDRARRDVIAFVRSLAGSPPPTKPAHP